jgi:hypothetical protein
MASDKQIIANQKNARRSTGPRTESGKRRSRRNAIRHGLTAETVIDILEDPADYRAFERAIKSNYSPQTAIEGQLVTRLASLLWRLRRAVTIESGLLSIQAVIIRDQSAARPSELNTDRLSIFRQFLRPELESPIHEQHKTTEEIAVNAIRSDKGETDHTNICTVSTIPRKRLLADGNIDASVVNDACGRITSGSG